ncbi:helix-turn-helix transcriptional regulator, partial [Staphylococcus aureus]
RKFKEAMFLKGFNLSDLSRETGVGISYLSQIINGKKIPSPKLAKKMAEVLQVEVNELFEFEVKEA